MFLALAAAAFALAQTAIVPGIRIVGAELCYGIIGDSFPAQRRGGALSIISALAGIGAGGGLLMGGLLIDHTSWQWVFWSGAIMSAVALVGVFRLRESPARATGKLDLVGVGMLGVGLTMPLLALSRTPIWGWNDARTIGLIACGLVVLVAFVFYERRVGEPLIDMRVLGRRPVLLTNIAMLACSRCSS